MTISLKTKLTGAIAVLVLLVVLATSTLYLSNLIGQALVGIERLGQDVANEIYSQAHGVIAQSRLPAGTDARQIEQLRAFLKKTLAEDNGLRLAMQSLVSYSPNLYYVALTDAHQEVIAHNDPTEVGQHFEPAVPLSKLVNAPLVQQLRVVYGPARVYEITLPLAMNGQPVADVRVGVSTIFLRDQITPALAKAEWLSVLMIVLATLSAGLIAFRLLRPLETIARGVDRLARGEYAQSIELKRSDEWGILSSKLNLLGEQMKGEKAAFVALKDNLDQLFSNLADGILLFDKEDRLVLSTPAVSRFLDQPSHQMIHHLASEIFSGDSKLHQLLRKSFEERRSTTPQTLQLGASGAVPKVEFSIQFVEAQGERMGALVTLRDAGTRAHLESQIDVAAKLAALGKLTSGVAHEVKNPLNAMVLQVELLKSKLGDQGDEVAPQLKILSAELRRLDRVVKTFLDFNRPVELRPAEVDVETLIHEVLALAEPQAKQNSVQLTLDRNGSLPRLRLDPDLMKQALLNLVLNGCQAMPAGGELKVRPRCQPDRVEIDIEDHGKGIPAEIRPRIFSLFFTTKPGGSGVGLAMASRIVQLHNGALNFDSEINHGTTFRVSLPR
jgi:signal transduction histidine kinase